MAVPLGVRLTCTIQVSCSSVVTCQDEVKSLSCANGEGLRNQRLPCGEERCDLIGERWTILLMRDLLLRGLGGFRIS